ncbi:hypothetical protein ACRARG_13240 [Pseudooceanicola sp. C21-150M6]|uniref:hypothetical protein n=1 Tax=Pseudooceanicola sp. C21-150M6 TaxID=3434355 RepID=UPI003D7F2414
MIHVKRFRAIVFLIAVLGGVALGMNNVAAGFGFFFFMMFVGLAARMLSMVMLAVTGTPLLYDVKTTLSNDGSNAKSF